MTALILTEFLRVFKAARSYFFAPCCRFDPTCTEYAQEALRREPLWRAAAMILGRVLRCHPFHPGGYDPVMSEGILKR